MGVFSKFWITLSPDDTGMYVGWEVWHLLRQGWVRPNNCGSQGLRILESNSRPRKDLDLSRILNFASLFNLGKFGADWFFWDEWSKLPEACFSLLLCLTFKLKPMLEVNKARRAKSLIRLGGRNTRVGNILKSNPSCLFLLCQNKSSKLLQISCSQISSSFTIHWYRPNHKQCLSNTNHLL